MGLCSLPVIYLGPNNSGGNEDNGGLLLNVPCMHCYIQCPQPYSRSQPPHTSAEVSWTLAASLGQSLVGSPLLSHRSWCTQSSACALQESVSSVLCKRCQKLVLKPWIRKFPGGNHGHLLQYSSLENSTDIGAHWAIVHGISTNQT